MVLELLKHAQWLQRRLCNDPGKVAWNRVKRKRWVVMARESFQVLRRK
jgi:hypothetical protein